MPRIDVFHTAIFRSNGGIRAQFAHGAGAVRNGVLFVGGHLGERLRIAVGDEQRVVAEPLVPGLAVDDPPLDDAFEKVLLAAEN